jgi:hypothetical protein
MKSLGTYYDLVCLTCLWTEFLGFHDVQSAISIFCHVGTVGLINLTAFTTELVT